MEEGYGEKKDRSYKNIQTGILKRKEKHQKKSPGSLVRIPKIKQARWNRNARDQARAPWGGEIWVGCGWKINCFRVLTGGDSEIRV